MAVTPEYGFVMPDPTDFVTDLPADFEIFGDAVDAQLKALSPGTTAGDVDYYTSSTAKARLPIGTVGQVLAVNAGATAPEWIPAPGGGKVLQVIQGTTTTSTNIASTSLTDTNLSATITPSLATSKVLVVLAQFFSLNRDAQGTGTGDVRLFRAATELFKSEPSVVADSAFGSTRINYTLSFTYLDSPASTSALTYKTQAAVANTGSNCSITAQQNSNSSAIILLEIGA
jgi:hypothetical protein